MPDRPNILLICVDQWRGDCLSIDGHPTVHTPHVDRLALQGVRFEQAYSATPTCIPARASLYTGQGQRSHGRVGYWDGIPWDYPTTLAGTFTDHGYQTQAVGKMHVHPIRKRMGFEHVVLHDGHLLATRKRTRDVTRVDDYRAWVRDQLGREADYFEHGVHCNSMVARPWDKPEYTHPTNYVASQSIDFLRRRDPTRPFFLFTSFHRPHPPFDPPRWAYEQYLGKDMPPPPIGDWVGLYADESERHDPRPRVGPIDEEVLHRARAGYHGCITHVDHQIGRLLEALREYGVKDNTYVCFISDHGEMLGDHHLFRKSVPYDGSARVPLILSGPPDSHLPEGEKRSEPVAELRDIMPTLLDCADCSVPDSVDGHSLVSAARGADGVGRPYLHGEHTVLGRSIQWLTDGHEKYVWHSDTGHEQFFDLDEDPSELHDRAAEAAYADRVSTWRDRLVETLVEAGDEEGFTDGERLTPVDEAYPLLRPLRQKYADRLPDNWDCA
jgi:arylsulfatase A-like enzyme